MRVFLALSLTLVFSSCAYQDFTKTCVFPTHTPMQEADASDLRMVVAWPRSADKTDTFLSLYDANQEPVLRIELAEANSDSVSNSVALSSSCRRAEKREYDLVVDQGDWVSYWDAARQSGRFFGFVAMPGIDPPIRANAVGLTLVDKNSGDLVWACGCLAK